VGAGHGPPVQTSGGPEPDRTEGASASPEGRREGGADQPGRARAVGSLAGVTGRRWLRCPAAARVGSVQPAGDASRWTSPGGDWGAAPAILSKSQGSFKSCSNRLEFPPRSPHRRSRIWANRKARSITRRDTCVVVATVVDARKGVAVGGHLSPHSLPSSGWPLDAGPVGVPTPDSRARRAPWISTERPARSQDRGWR
jgi:hypothetical protein